MSEGQRLLGRPRYGGGASATYLFARSDRPNGTQGKYSVWALSVFLVGATIAALIAFLLRGNEEYLWIAVAAAITSLPFSAAAVQRPRRLLHPLSLYGTTMLFGVFGQTIYLQFGDSKTSTELLVGEPHSIIPRALLIICAGTIALLIGFLLPDGQPKGRLVRRLATGLSRPSYGRAVVTVVTLCAVSVLAFAIYAPRVGVVALQDILNSQKQFASVGDEAAALGYLRWGMGLAGSAAIISAYTLAVMRHTWRSLLGLLVALSMALTAYFALVTSSRSDLLVTVAAASLTVAAVHQRQPRWRSVVIVLLLSLVTIASLGALRSSSQRGRDFNLLNGAVSGPVEQLVAARDWMDIGPLAVVFDKVPEEMDYQYGATFLSLATAPVPRTIWPDKPPVRIGPIVGRELFDFPDYRRTGDPPGIIGELWINGGWPAVLIGMAALGRLLQLVDRLYHQSASTQGIAALLYGVTAVAVALRLPANDFNGIAIVLIREYIVLFLAVRFIQGRRTEQRTARSLGSCQPSVGGLVDGRWQ